MNRKLSIACGTISLGLAIATVALSQVSQYGSWLAIGAGLFGLAAGLYGGSK